MDDRAPTLDPAAAAGSDEAVHSVASGLEAEAAAEAAAAAAAAAETEAAETEAAAAEAAAAEAAAAEAAAAAAAAAFDAPGHIDALLASLGPAGFLENATRHAAAVDAIYRKVQARSKVLPVVERLPRGAQLDDGGKAGLRAWFFTPASTGAECAQMFERRFRIQLPGGGAFDHAPGRTGASAGDQPPLTKPCLARLWAVYEALPPSYVETDPQLLHVLHDHNNGPGSAWYAVPGTGEQGDILLAHPAAGSLAPDAGYELDPVYQVGGPVYQASAGGDAIAGAVPGEPAEDPAQLDATLRHELLQLFDRGDAPMQTAFATIACRCGARYPAEVAAGPLVSLHPDVRRQIVGGAFHRFFCRACGMTTLVDAPRWLTDLSRRQWYTVAPSAGLPWRGAWLAAERARFEAVMMTDAPALVAGWGAEMTRRLVFGLAPLREKLVAAAAGLDDRVVELFKLQLVRDLRDRLSAADYFHLVGASDDELAFERTHPDGLIRRFRLSRVLYDALAMDPTLPTLVELAFPDGLLIDHRAMLVPEAAGAEPEAAGPPRR